MTYAVVPALRSNPELADGLRAAADQPRVRPGAASCADHQARHHRRHVDDREAGRLRRARQHHPGRRPTADGTYSLTGHKWFTSAPMCDLFLVLAQAPGGLSLLPAAAGAARRHAATGCSCSGSRTSSATTPTPPARSSTTAPTAWLVGEEGRGVPTIIEMVNLTRLDCTLGSATSMRTGLTRAIHHAQHRKAFGAYLIDQPLMRNVLADLAVEAEAATIVAMRMAGATDKAVRGDDTRGAAAPHRSGGQQVLGVQARHPARRRGAGMPGRQRLRRGLRHAAAVPRGAADGHLGGLGQRQRAGHVARHGNSARMRRGAVRRAGRDAPGRTRAWTPTSTRLRPRLDDLETIAVPRPARSPRTSAWRCRARCWCATATPPSPRRS